MLVPLRPSSEHILIVRAPGARDQHGCHSIHFIAGPLRARKTVWLLPCPTLVAKTTTARPGITRPRRVLLNASPLADAVALSSNGERHRRQTNRLIGEQHATYRSGRGL